MRLHWLLILLLFVCSIKNAQSLEIKGKVVDAVNGDILPFANVSVVNTNRSAATDKNGEFVFSLPSNNYTFTISYIGYKTERVYISTNDKTLFIKLTPINYLLQEVSVYSKKRDQISTMSLQDEQIKNFAGLTKDALRSVQLLPGVSANNEASAKVNVRGGSYDENLILINGVEVYNPFHLKAISMASVGIFNIDFVKNIDFSAGGYSAEYGNALSSVMSVDYDNTVRKKYSGKADLSLVDLSANYQGPIDSSSSFMLGVRQSYFDYLMRLTKVPNEIRFSYYDVTGSFLYQLSPRDKIIATIILSKDFSNQDPTTTTASRKILAKFKGNLTTGNRTDLKYKEIDATYQNVLASLKYDKILTDRIFTQTFLSMYSETEDEREILNNRSDFSYPEYTYYWAKYTFDANLIDKLNIRTLSLKQNLAWSLSDFYNLKSGFEYRNIYYDYDRRMYGKEFQYNNINNYPDTIIIPYPADPQYNDTTYINTRTFRTDGYVENIFQITENLIVNAGIRAGYLDMNKQFRLSPRLSFSYSFPSNLVARLALGVYYLPPSFRQLRSTEPSKDNTAYQKAYHYIIGLDKKFSEDVSLKVESYYKKYSDLIPTIRLGDGTLAYGNKENNFEGYAAGFDIQLTAKLGGFDAWFSYGYLVAKEKLIGNNPYYPRYTDQRHTLSTVIGYNLGSNWNVSVRGFYGSGYAYTPYYTAYDSVSNIYRWTPGDKNTSHYPAYQRVDLRISKSFSFSENILNIYLDILNIFNRKNILSYAYSYDESLNPERREKKLFGILPTIGISYSF